MEDLEEFDKVTKKSATQAKNPDGTLKVDPITKEPIFADIILQESLLVKKLMAKKEYI